MLVVSHRVACVLCKRGLTVGSVDALRASLCYFIKVFWHIFRPTASSGTSPWVASNDQWNECSLWGVKQIQTLRAGSHLRRLPWWKRQRNQVSVTIMTMFSNGCFQIFLTTIYVILLSVYSKYHLLKISGSWLKWKIFSTATFGCGREESSWTGDIWFRLVTDFILILLTKFFLTFIGLLVYFYWLKSNQKV